MRWRLRSAFLAVLVGVLSATAPAQPAAADVPTLTLTGAASCEQNYLGYETASWTVIQTPGPLDKIDSYQASPLTWITSSSAPAPDTIVLRQWISEASAASVNFHESLTVTVAVATPQGTVNLTASASVTLALCQAPVIAYAAEIFTQHCDRSVDASVAYAPGYAAAPTTITFDGWKYGVNGAPDMVVDVTVSPGQTAHVFFPPQYAYYIVVEQDHVPLQYGYEYFIDVPAGCPYIPPVGAPGTGTSTPPPASSSAPGTSASPTTQPAPGQTGGAAGGSTGGAKVPGAPQQSAAAASTSGNTTTGTSQATKSGADNGQTLVTTIDAQSTVDDSILLWSVALGVLSLAAVVTFLLLRRRRSSQRATET